MNRFSLRLSRYLLPLTLLLTASAWLRADDPPVQPPVPPAVEKKADPAPTAAPAAQPELKTTPAPISAAPVASDGAAAENAEKLAEKARNEAEKIAEKAQAEAEQVAEKARADAEKIAEQARAHAEQVAEQARTVAAHAQELAEQSNVKSGKKARHYHSTRNSDGDRVTVMNDNLIPVGEVVTGAAVAVMGDLTMNGEANSDAVAVMGDNTINGPVHGNAVVVLGNLTLGPKAVVDGDIVVVGGILNRDPGAVVQGRAEIQTFGGRHFNFDNLGSWWNHGLKLGRPLAIGAHLGWLWIITAFSVAFYALLGLVFPGKIRSCGDKLVAEPGLTILAGMLGILALPVLFVLLLITIIGIPVALLVLPVGTLLIAMFGKAAIYGLVGRRLSGDKLQPAVAVIVGALCFVLLYLIPVVGLVVSLLVWFLGFGCAVLSIFSRTPKPAKPVVPPTTPSAAVPPVMPAAASGFAEATVVTEAIPPLVPVDSPAADSATAIPVSAIPVPPPVAAAVPITADTLPRAGFWIRLAATFLDFMLVMVSLEFFVKGLLRVNLEGPGLVFLAIAAYHAVMWKLKGTTIGGVICHLKVVRLDDRPIDWGVAVVRALTAFLSFIVAGLGFIWVAFDEGKQSWHDKVAGTTIVRVPRGTPLI